MPAVPFHPDRARTLAERALSCCANPDCQAHAPNGVATVIRAPARAEADPSDFATLDNGLWLCPDCAAGVEANRVLAHPSRLRGWATEQSNFLRRHLPPLPDVRVRPLRVEPNAALHELSFVNRSERDEVQLSVVWQWPEPVVRCAGEAELAEPGGDPCVVLSRLALRPGQRGTAQVASQPERSGVALLEAGPRAAREGYGRGHITFLVAGLIAQRTFVVPLELEPGQRELRSISVDDDVHNWALRARARV